MLAKGAGRIYGLNNSEWIPVNVNASGNFEIGIGDVTVEVDIGEIEGTPYTSGDKGVMTLAVRQDAISVLADNGDYIPLVVDKNGRLYTKEENTSAIKTAIETVGGAISGNEMQCDIVASLPAGANKLGEIEVLGNTSPDGSGTSYHLLTDDSGRLHTRSFRDAAGNGKRMLVDGDRHGQVDVLSGSITETNSSAIKIAVESIGDLQNALKSIDTDELINRITDSSGVEINPATEDGNVSGIKKAVEIIDNFISGSRGLVIEDNSSAIQAAVETIDNFISGNRGLVTEDNSLAIMTSIGIMDDWESATIADAADVVDNFTGAVYHNEHIMVNDSAYRFESTTTKLRDMVLIVSEQDLVMGDSSNQSFPLAVEDTIGFTKVDLSTMYFRNASTGTNTKINLVGTRE